jgi:ribonuclease T
LGGLSTNAEARVDNRCGERRQHACCKISHVTDEEVFISVDVEASGPTPSAGSLIAIGACLVDELDVAFYTLIKPLAGLEWRESAEKVHRLSREQVDRDGLEPSAAIEAFGLWVESVVGDRHAVFVGWNAGFDWMFVADYFERYVGHNPFGVAPLDMKAYVMGRHRLPRWADTRRQALDGLYGRADPLTHQALEDARKQAAFVRRLLEQDDQDR